MEKKEASPKEQNTIGSTTASDNAEVTEAQDEKNEVQDAQSEAAGAKDEKSTGRLPLGLTKKKLIILAVAAAVVIAAVLVFVIPSFRSGIVKNALKSDLGEAIAEEVLGDGYEKNVLDRDFDRSKVAINEGVSTPEGYRVVALFGVDARGEELRQGSRADTMMLISINEKTGELKMGSVYRDTYLVDDCNEYDEYYISKANAAYAVGGPEGALSMLNRNWDLAVTDYVVVNFGGMANIVDAMGGVELEVTEEEVEEINYHMGGQIDSYGGEYVPVEDHGLVELNGAQATAFCRIRSVPFKSPVDGKTYEIDYGRTARQRYTLNTLFAKAKNEGMSFLIHTINEVCDNNVGDNRFILSSLPLDEFMKIMSFVLDMNIAGQEAFPNTDLAYITMLDSGLTIVAETLEKNMILMHEFLYGEKAYKASDDFHKYDNWITRRVNFQKTGSADIMFDHAASGEDYGSIENYIPDEDEEIVTYVYIKDEEAEPVTRNKDRETEAATEATERTSAETKAPETQPVEKTTAATEPATKATEAPTEAPTAKPTEAPTEAPTEPPTEAPTQPPTEAPTQPPTEPPTEAPTQPPTEAPTEAPTETEAVENVNVEVQANDAE